MWYVSVTKMFVKKKVCENEKSRFVGILPGTVAGNLVRLLNISEHVLAACTSN